MLGKIRNTRIEHNNKNEVLVIETTDDTYFVSFDTSQQCCEEFMIDVPDEIKGATGEELLEIRVAPSNAVNVTHTTSYPTSHLVSNVVFVVIVTDRYNYVTTGHNYHNGWYAHAWSVRSEKRGVLSEGEI